MGFLQAGDFDGITISLSQRAYDHEQERGLGMDCDFCEMVADTKLTAGRRGLTDEG